MKRTWIAAALLGLTFTSQASAVTVVSVKHWRNATSIAVQATVTGDADTAGTKVCQIFQRCRPSAAFDSGMVMSRRPGTYIWHGRILWLPPGDTCDYYVETRGINATVRSAVDTATCTRIPYFSANGGGTDTYANASIGSNSNDGLAATQVSAGVGPKKTIQAAIDALNTAHATDGSTVHVAIGEYHEIVTLTSWTDGLHFRLLGDSRDSSIVCGANPNVEAGRYDASNAMVWTFTNQDSCYVAFFPSNGGPADSTQLIVLGFGELLHRKTSIKGILDDSTVVSPGCGSSTNQGELSGWFWRNDSLYVKRKNGQSPSVSGNHFGYLNCLVRIYDRNWTVSNLSVRYSGGQRTDNLATETAYKNANDQGCGTTCQAGKTNPPLDGHAFRLGFSGVGNSQPAGVVLYNLRLYGCNQTFIFGPLWAGGVQVDSVTVANCVIDGLTVGDMFYSAGKCRPEESLNAMFVTASMLNFYGNRVNGVFNGISSDGIVVPDTTGASYCEYSYNRFSHLADDTFEFDGSASQNVLVLRNSLQRVQSGFSATPAKFGPIYIFYNTFATVGRGAKLGGANIAPTYWYHDTFYPDSMPPLAVTSQSTDNGGGVGFQHNYFRNCIFASRATSPSIPVVGMQAADSARMGTNEFNYNQYYQRSGSNIATWAGTNFTITTLRSSFSWEKDGNFGVWSANQSFVSPSTYNFNLTVRSVGVAELGVRIAGVNTAFGANKAKLFPGAATPAKPDKGALEFSNRRHRSWWKRTYTHS